MGKYERESGHPMFYELLQKMADIHSVKNQDYGGGNPLGNFEESKKFGIDPFMGVLVRLSDKWSRICSLAKKKNMEGAVKDESIEDTLIDLANYSILALVIKKEMENEETKNMKKEYHPFLGEENESSM